MAWYNIFGTRPPTQKELDEEQKARLAKAALGAEVFGPKPSDSFKDTLRADRARWERYVFERLDVKLELQVPDEAFEVYYEREIGLPVFWQDKEGDQFASFPTAKFYQPKENDAHRALYAAGDTYAYYQIRAIDGYGGYFDKLHPKVAIVANGEYTRRNDENRKKAEGETAQA